MGTFTSIENFSDLQEAGMKHFLDGVLGGTPLGKNVAELVTMGAAFGGEEARRGNPAMATAAEGTLEDMQRTAVGLALEYFVIGNIKELVRHSLLVGVAFGHGNVSRLEKI